MPSVRKHSLAVAREKGHIRDWQGRGAARRVGVSRQLQRWAAWPKEDGDETKLLSYFLGRRVVFADAIMLEFF